MATKRKPQNRKKPVAGRLANGRFAAGNKANPGGRPKKLAILSELCRENTNELVEILFTAARDRKAGWRDRVAAIKELWDRGYGKAPAKMEVTGGLDLRQSVAALSPAERRAEIEQLQTQLKGG